MVGDGEWNYLVIDLYNEKNIHFIPNNDGTYSLKYLRIRYGISEYAPGELTTLDIAFLAFADAESVLTTYVSEQTGETAPDDSTDANS